MTTTTDKTIGKLLLITTGSSLVKVRCQFPRVCTGCMYPQSLDDDLRFNKQKTIHVTLI